MESGYNGLEGRTANREGLPAWTLSHVLTPGSWGLLVSSEEGTYFPPVGRTQETNLLSYKLT